MPDVDLRFTDLLQQLTSRNLEEKLLAIRALGVLRIPQHADHLKDVLGSPEPNVVREALLALGSIRNTKSIKYLLEFLNAESPEIGGAAVEALRGFDLIPVLDQILKASGASCPPPMRCQILTLVNGINDPRVAALMQEILMQTHDKELLVEALHFMVRFPSPDRRELIRRHAMSGEWEVSLVANVALTRLKEETSRAPLKRLIKSPALPIRLALVETLNLHPVIDDREMYAAFFSDAHPSVRRAALTGFPLFAADERIRLIQEGFVREKDPALNEALWRQAVFECHPQLYVQFLQGLASPQPVLRRLAHEGLVGLGSRIIDRLLRDFEAQSLQIREQMLLVLGNIGGAAARNLCLSCLEGKERWIRINAVEALAVMGNPSDADFLRSMLERGDLDIWVRAKLITALGRLRDENSVPLLVQQLRHVDARVRANAVEALVQLGGAGQIPQLVPFLRDRNDRVRVNVAIGLWQLGRAEVIQELAKMTKEPSKWVRCSAAFAFGEIGHKGATPVLLKLLSDKDDLVFRNALEALAKIGDLRALLPILRESKRGRIPEGVFQDIFSQYSAKLRA